MSDFKEIEKEEKKSLNFIEAKVVEDLRTMGKIDQAAKLAGNTVTMVLTPLPAGQRVKKFKKYEEEDFDAESSEFDATDDE